MSTTEGEDEEGYLILTRLLLRRGGKLLHLRGGGRGRKAGKNLLPTVNKKDTSSMHAHQAIPDETKFCIYLRRGGAFVRVPRMQDLLR